MKLKLKKAAIAFAIVSATSGTLTLGQPPAAKAQATSSQGPFSFPLPALGPNYTILNGSDPATNPSYLATRPPAGSVGSGAGANILANGTQDYVCRANAAGVSSWVFTGPRANLYEVNWSGVRLIGNHYNLQGTAQAGTSFDGPRWRNADGNIVRGRVIASAPGRPGAIPWLLLRAEVEAGFGDFTTWGQTTYITRTSTVGGVAPAASLCNGSTVGTVAQVPYSAAYNFFQPDPVDYSIS
jgi:Protein of unknown function (DUF3455)